MALVWNSFLNTFRGQLSKPIIPEQNLARRGFTRMSIELAQIRTTKTKKQRTSALLETKLIKCNKNKQTKTTIPIYIPIIPNEFQFLFDASMAHFPLTGKFHLMNDLYSDQSQGNSTQTQKNATKQTSKFPLKSRKYLLKVFFLFTRSLPLPTDLPF